MILIIEQKQVQELENWITTKNIGFSFSQLLYFKIFRVTVSVFTNETDSSKF